jgi:hypothetical protein
MEDEWTNSSTIDQTKSPEEASLVRDLLPDYIISLNLMSFKVWPAFGRFL